MLDLSIKKSRTPYRTYYAATSPGWTLAVKNIVCLLNLKGLASLFSNKPGMIPSFS